MAGPIPFTPIINGNDVTIQRLSASGETGEETWGYNASINSGTYTISGNTVVWNDGTILQYNGVDVLPTDNIMDGAEYTTRAASSKLSVDLTTLSGWANLSSGNHTIKIKAKGTGYKDSELSAGVTVSKAPSTVTLEAGTYKWKDNPTFTSSFNETVSYTSNGVDWDRFRVQGVQNIITYGIPNTNVYVNHAWTDTAYQTITLSAPQTVSPEFYKWAITQGNLVKQTGYNLTINYSTVPMSTSAAYIKINSDTVSSTNYDYVVQPGTSSTNPTLKNSAGTTLTVPYVVPNVEKVAFMGGLAIAVGGSTNNTSPYTLTADTTISPGVYGPTADTPIDGPTI